jgi:hypothetical protein
MASHFKASQLKIITIPKIVKLNKTIILKKK